VRMSAATSARVRGALIDLMVHDSAGLILL
jgi:hypothetical protein